MIICPQPKPIWEIVKDAVDLVKIIIKKINL